LEGILAVVGGISEEYVLDGTGLVHQHDMGEWQATDDDWLLEMVFRPAFERVAPECGNEAKGPGCVESRTDAMILF
jgi:hypothetical protein